MKSILLIYYSIPLVYLQKNSFCTTRPNFVKFGADLGLISNFVKFGADLDLISNFVKFGADLDLISNFVKFGVDQNHGIFPMIKSGKSEL